MKAMSSNNVYTMLYSHPTLVETQAFLAAPLFVVCEVLFDFGYKKGMQQRVKINAAASIAEFRMSKLAKAAIKKN